MLQTLHQHRCYLKHKLSSNLKFVLFLVLVYICAACALRCNGQSGSSLSLPTHPGLVSEPQPSQHQHDKLPRILHGWKAGIWQSMVAFIAPLVPDANSDGQPGDRLHASPAVGRTGARQLPPNDSHSPASPQTHREAVLSSMRSPHRQWQSRNILQTTTSRSLALAAASPSVSTTQHVDSHVLPSAISQRHIVVMKVCNQGPVTTA